MGINIVDNLLEKGFGESEIVRSVKVIVQNAQVTEQNGSSVEEVVNDLREFANGNLALDMDAGGSRNRIMAACWYGFQAEGHSESFQLEPIEVEQLIQTIEDPKVRLIVAVISETDMRKTELLAVTANDVDCANNMIRIKRRGEYVSHAISADLSSQLEQYVRGMYATSEYPLFRRHLTSVDHVLHRAGGRLKWKKPISLKYLRRYYQARRFGK